MTTKTKMCSKCKTEVSFKAKFCNMCGNNKFNTSKTCKYCDVPFPSKNPNPKFCPNCGKRIGEGSIKMKTILSPDGDKQKCAICLQEIDIDLVFCPNCANTYHFPHLANWILEKEACPMCKTKLVFAD